MATEAAGVKPKADGAAVAAAKHLGDSPKFGPATFHGKALFSAHGQGDGWRETPGRQSIKLQIKNDDNDRGRVPPIREDTMKKLLAAAVLAALLPGASLAATLQFPSDEPVASITIPDDWSPKETDGGIEANAADDAIYLAIDVTDEAGTEDVVKECIEYLKGAGVTVDTSTQKESSGTLNGMQATSLDWSGKDNDGDVSIALTFVSPKPGKILVITYWGTKGMQEQHGPTLDAMISSLQVVQ